MATAQQPLDFAVEADQLKRRQALADALTQQALTANPGRMQGNYYVGPNAMSAMGMPIIQALMAKKMNSDIEEATKNFSDRYRAAQVAKTPEYGTEPRMMKDETGKLVSALFAKDGSHKIVEGLTPAVKQEATAGGQLYNPYSGSKGTWLGEQYGPTQMVQGEAVQFDQRSGKAHQVANRPAQVRVSQSVVDKGETEFMKGIGKDTADMVKTARANKQAAQQTAFAADRLDQLDKQGVFNGPAANLAVTMGAFANSIGVPVDQAKLGRSEEYNAVLAQQVAKVLTNGSVGRSMTDEDRKRFEQQFPQLVSSPAGRQQIIGMLRHAAKQDIDYADQLQQNLNQQYPEAGRLMNITPSNQPYPPSPAPSAAPAQGVPMSLDAYLKSKRGG